MRNFKKQLLFIIILFLYSVAFFGQFESEKHVSFEAESLKIDPLGNIYTFNNKILRKYNDPQIDPISYSSTSYGHIFDIDVSDPLRILVFFKDFQKVVFLDQTLSPIGTPIDLFDMGFNQVAGICSSRQNGFWFYSLSENKLFHLNDQSKIDYSSMQFDKVISDSANFISMQEKDGKVFIRFSQDEIIITDRFANFLEKIYFNKIKSFQPLGSNICVLGNNNFVFHDLQTNERKSMPIPQKTAVEYFHWLGDRLFLFAEDTLKIYKKSG